MITFLLGLPGSGKSYEGVDRIYHNFSNDDEAKKDRKATFKNCYTNINEFKFDLVENVYPLDKDEVLKHITHAHGMYKKKSTDEEILKYLEENNLKDTLFVIDEAHNWFDVNNAVLVWWLSYHRHLYHEIILITQNLSLIHAKYKAFSEFFYVARNQSLTLDKRYFFYAIYCSSKLNKASKSGVKKVRRNKKVFELYKSGDSIQAQNVVMKFLLISLILLIVLVLSFYYYFNVRLEDEKNHTDETSLKVEKQLDSINKISSKKINDTSRENIEHEYEMNKYFTLVCTSSSCSNEDIDIPPLLLRKFIDEKIINVLYTSRLSNHLYKYYLDCSSEFYNYLAPKEIENEDDNIMFDNPKSALGV